MFDRSLLSFGYDFWFGDFKWSEYSQGGFGKSNDETGVAALSSPLPIYLGLMAIAGAYLIKDRKNYNNG